MTRRQRVLVYAAMLGAALAILALGTCGSAPATQGVPTPTPTASPAAAGGILAPLGPTVGEVAASKQQATTTTTAPSPSPNAPVTGTQKVITLAPVTALFSQATVDKGKLVTWMTDPVCLLAGHDSMGWQWLDDVATGRTVKVTTGPCAGTYRVTGHRHQAQKGGPIPGWMSDPSIDLVLQTCTGASGMGFSLAVRVAG